MPTPVHVTDSNIFRQIQLGDQEAFESLYRFFFPKLKYFANQYLADSDVADNIVQDAFTELWANRQQLNVGLNTHAWLFTVVKNKSLKLIDKERSRERFNDYLKARQLDLSYRMLDRFDTSDLAFAELQTKIEAALEKLSAPVRQVFEKSRFEDKKNREIADELGISLKTVEAHVSKALKLLREELKDYLPLIGLLFFSK